MNTEISYEPLEHYSLSDAEYTMIGRIIHGTTILDASICMLGIHLRMMKSRDPSKYERLYEKNFGKPGSINFVREYLVNLPESESMSLKYLLDVCEEFFDHRNALAHGLPSQTRDGTPMMWRQSDKVRTDPGSALQSREVALQIDAASLNKIMEDLQLAQRQVMLRLHFYWPPFRGENPMPVETSVASAKGMTRNDILNPEGFFESSPQGEK